MFSVSKEVREDLDALRKQHKELREEHDKLARFVDLEWEELKDKVKRWMQRTATRDRVDAARSDLRADPNGPAAPDPISAQLLARRNRGGTMRQLQAVEDEGSGQSNG